MVFILLGHIALLKLKVGNLSDNGSYLSPKDYSGTSFVPHFGFIPNIRPLQLVYVFLVHRPPRTRPLSVNVLYSARITYWD